MPFSTEMDFPSLDRLLVVEGRGWGYRCCFGSEDLAGTLSSPEAFRGFRLAKSFCTPSSLMVSIFAGGCAGLANLLAEDFALSLVNTDLNCSLNIQALE